MLLEFNQVNEVLKRQPVGYYVGRSIKVTLKNCNSSYYSLSTDEIVISYPQVMKCFLKLSELGIAIDSKTVVRIIRTILYHEVGHAMLTGKEITRCMEWIHTQELKDALNIMEDERIEMILDGYVKNTNFKEVIQLISAEPGQINTPIAKFFELVRLNIYESGWTERVDQLLIDNCNLTYGSDYWTLDRYVDQVKYLYLDYKDAHQDDEESNDDQDYESNKNANSNGNDTNSNNSDSQDNNGSTEDIESVQQKLDQMNQELDDGDPQGYISDSVKQMIQEILDNLEITDEETSNFDQVMDEVESEQSDPCNSKSRGPEHSAAKIFEQCNQQFIDDKLYQELSRIFNSVNKVHKMNSSAVNAYSGVIDPRSAGRNDYKFFVQRNRGGNQKAYSKVHLNLFLDRSGSFYSNQDKANAIIHTLTKIEKMNPDFSYTLVTIGEFPRIEDKKNIFFIADGGNELTDEVPKVFKEVQERNAVNYNLVLFDGYACWMSSQKPNWGAFNTNNTLIISDPDNEEEIAEYCKNARSIITTNYTEELIDNIIKVLGSIVR